MLCDFDLLSMLKTSDTFCQDSLINKKLKKERKKEKKTTLFI